MSLTVTKLSTVQAHSTDALARLLKATADPLRLDILRLLGQSSFGVMELATMFATSQPGMSHHLKVLTKAGWVETRREGNSIFYRRRLPHANEPSAALITQLLATLDALPLSDALEQQLERVQEQRAAQSREFFSRYSDLFAERQDLIAECGLYGDAAWDMLQRARPEAGGSVLEIGPGQGDFLLRLAANFDEVLGVDSSADLLAKLQTRCNTLALEHVRLLHAEWPKLAPEADCDVAVFNMVLHHMPTPARSLAAVAKALRPGGVLLITELCRHQQDWAKTRCGDLWLGFDDAELIDWCQRVGLEFGESQFLAQKNGFQIEILSFHKI